MKQIFFIIIKVTKREVGNFAGEAMELDDGRFLNLAKQSTRASFVDP